MALADVFGRRAPQMVQPPDLNVGGVNFARTPSSYGQRYGSVEDLIEGRAPQGIGLIQSGTDEAVRLAELARTQGAAPLESLVDLRALNERNALLGLSGAEAQTAAIGNIPVSEFDRELQRRQQETLLRQASVTGDLGGGASIANLSALAGEQQSSAIQNRLAQLDPLVQIARGLTSSLSSIDEQELMRQAELLQSGGTQAANIRLGTTAPAVQAIQNRGELAGLRAVSGANQRAQVGQQLAQLIPYGVQAYQNYNVGQDLNAAFANNPAIFG